jgi:hypothetical protein
MKASRDVFGDTLVSLGSSDPNVVVLDADFANSTKADKFAKMYPGRFLTTGEICDDVNPDIRELHELHHGDADGQPMVAATSRRKCRMLSATPLPSLTWEKTRQ